jgi:hypothetical protein
MGTSAVSVLEGIRQEGHRFKAKLGYTVKNSLSKKKKKKEEETLINIINIK